MKKFSLIFAFVFIGIFAIAQDVVILKHTNYTAHYSKSKKYPVMVEWWETRAKVGCASPIPRKDNFKPDPQLPKETDLAADYVGSGLDRGHMMPAKSNQCQTPQVQDECFYFSNMAAQYHSLNAGDWKSLETFVRQKTLETDSIKVFAGNFGEISKIGRVSVPKYCWKVIYIKKEKKWLAYLFENNKEKPNGFGDNEVTLEKITKLTGFKFL